MLGARDVFFAVIASTGANMIERSSRYLAWIRTLECTICGLPPSEYKRIEAAHTKLLGSGGTGLKSSDYSCVPLCTNCHTMRPHAYHKYGTEAEWAAFWRIKLDEVVAGLNRQWEAICNRRAQQKRQRHTSLLAQLKPKEQVDRIPF